MFILSSIRHISTKIFVNTYCSRVSVVLKVLRVPKFVWKKRNFGGLYYVVDLGFTRKYGCFFSSDLFEKDHTYLETKLKKLFWGSLPTIDLSKMPMGGGNLCNYPGEIGATSQLLISCMKPITFLVKRY